MKRSKYRGKHLLFVIGLIIVVFVAGIFASNLLPGTAIFAGTSYESSVKQNFAMEAVDYDSGSDRGSLELEIMTGSASIKSEAAEGDFKIIEEKVGVLEGHVEETYSSESETTIRLTSTVRVPKDSLRAFSEWIETNFEVEQIGINAYRLDITIQTSLVDIYTESLAKYQELMDSIDGSDLDADAVSTLAALVERMVYSQSRLEYAAHQLAESEEDAAMSRFTLTIEQKKPVKLLPEDYSRTFMNQVKTAISQFLDVLVGTILFLPVFLLKVLKYVVYGVLLLLILKPIVKRCKKWKKK
ncbi:MAG: DUF4349 domain-containing protein [Candidatus Altiarchaeota archaeon]|nr:DUF4349 domain-containing protein [Candidatus Altiarchaeota archaeon]